MRFSTVLFVIGVALLANSSVAHSGSKGQHKGVQSQHKVGYGGGGSSNSTCHHKKHSKEPKPVDGGDQQHSKEPKPVYGGDQGNTTSGSDGSASGNGTVPGSQDGSQADGQEQQACLDEHNKARKDVHTKPLVWSTSLESDALAYGKVLASNGCALQHSSSDQRPGEGENLFMGSGADFGLVDAVKSFNAEKGDYKPGDYSHYTQVVWKDTTDVGCAKAKGYDGCIVVVCRYHPPGNFVGEPAY